MIVYKKNTVFIVTRSVLKLVLHIWSETVIFDPPLKTKAKYCDVRSIVSIICLNLGPNPSQAVRDNIWFPHNLATFVAGLTTWSTFFAYSKDGILSIVCFESLSASVRFQMSCLLYKHPPITQAHTCLDTPWYWSV